MSERQYQVLTAVGEDRPGLVEKISSMLLRCGANLEDSRMAILGGEFALILLFSGDASAVSAVDEARVALAKDLELRIDAKSTGRQRAPSDYLPYTLRTSGVDRPGIVARVSAVLAGNEVNVAALESRVSYAPLTGTPLFQLEAELQVPSRVGLSKLRAQLNKLCDDENLDFWLESGRS